MATFHLIDSTEMWHWPSLCDVLFPYSLQPFHERQLFPVHACAESYCTIRTFLHTNICRKTTKMSKVHILSVLSVVVLHVQAIASWVPSFSNGCYLLLRHMWHSQILGSFEAKNITCVFLHENSNLAIEITKDVFPDVKKCKKVRKSGLKRLFCIFQPYAGWPGVSIISTISR